MATNPTTRHFKSTGRENIQKWREEMTGSPLSCAKFRKPGVCSWLCQELTLFRGPFGPQWPDVWIGLWFVGPSNIRDQRKQSKSHLELEKETLFQILDTISQGSCRRQVSEPWTELVWCGQEEKQLLWRSRKKTGAEKQSGCRSLGGRLALMTPDGVCHCTLYKGVS